MITIDKCEFCGLSDFSFLTDKGDKFSGEKVNICNGCGLIFLSPRMGTEELIEYYEEDEFSRDFRDGLVSPDERKIENNKRRAQIRWDHIKFLADDAASLLEIGCSSGEFLELAQHGFGFVRGIDPSTGYVNHAKSKGLNVVCGEFPRDDSDSIYDVICMFHTLEHMENPLQVLRDIYDRLNAAGLLVLEYPDVEMASRRNNFSSKYFQKSHLYDFSFNNLLIALDRCGFAVRKSISGWGYPQDKNALLICEKSNISGGTPYDSSFAKELCNRISAKLHQIEVIENEAIHIAHFASHHINVGDGAIITSIRNRLSELYKTPIHFTNIDLVDYFHHGSYFDADWINQQNYDLILIGGGGTIDGHAGRVFNGTAFTMPLDEMRKLETPVAFVGLGDNTYYNQEFHHAKELETLVSLCQEKGWPFSVRADGSKKRLLQKIPNVIDYLDEIPDPGFFIAADKSHKPIGIFEQISAKRIILQATPDAYEHRFSNRENFISFLELMGRYFYYFANTHSCRFMLAAHTTDDIVAYNVIQGFLAGTDAYRFTRAAMSILGTAHPVNAPQFFRAYEMADLVVGMRGHSIICATGLGIPVIAIDTHPKIRGYMEELGLEKWCLSPRELDEGQELVKLSLELLTDPSEQLEIVKETTKDYQNQFDSFLLRCLGLIS